MGVIKIKNLKKEDYSGLSGWAQSNHKGPYKREIGRSESQKEM